MLFPSRVVSQRPIPFLLENARKYVFQNACNKQEHIASNTHVPLHYFESLFRALGNVSKRFSPYTPHCKIRALNVMATTLSAREHNRLYPFFPLAQYCLISLHSFPLSFQSSSHLWWLERLSD